MVRSRTAPGGFKISKLGGFEVAFLINKPNSLNKKYTTGNKRSLMAPEAEAGLFRDASVDIWSLGQLSYQLLSLLPHSQDQTDRYLLEDKPTYWVKSVSDDVK